MLVNLELIASLILDCTMHCTRFSKSDNTTMCVAHGSQKSGLRRQAQAD